MSLARPSHKVLGIKASNGLPEKKSNEGSSDEAWNHVMKKKAKSFYWASLLFPKSFSSRVKALYALCRWIDDAVDEAPTPEVALEKLDHIACDLRSSNSQLAVNRLYKEHHLDLGYMGDLMEGARYDLQKVRVQTVEELIQYSYKVAGTVGLAMFDLMGVKLKQARAHAVDLGIGMQITNICRDVKEDLKKDRIYLPLELLEKYQISEEEFIHQTYRPEQLGAVIRELIKLSNQYYLSASCAFHSIPFAYRGAIIMASSLYQGIGFKILKKEANPMKGRIYLSPLEKFPLLIKSLGLWLFSGRFKAHAPYPSPLQHDPQRQKALGHWRELRGFQS